jgi:cytochrome b6-f complex iron-sulfur subunit
MTVPPAKGAAHRNPGRTVLFAGLAVVTVVALLAAGTAFAWPSADPSNPTSIVVRAFSIPTAGGEPLQIAEGKFWLVNLLPREGQVRSNHQPESVVTPVGGISPGGLLALSWRDPHLGCTVPWKSNFNFEGEQGWFRNPCHAETYSKAGISVFGPSPRSLDTMRIRLNDDGSIAVFFDELTLGDLHNPHRAVPYDRTDS